MNLDNERKAFDKWVLTHPDNLDLTAYEENIMFDAWLASANREGYKLVPKYHQENIRDALIIACDIKDDEQRFEDSLNYVHKAMIGACDDH